jgi:hypothetical protein
MPFLIAKATDLGAIVHDNLNNSLGYIGIIEGKVPKEFHFSRAVKTA